MGGPGGAEQPGLMAGHEWEDWFEREEFIGQISDMRVQNLQVEREVVQKRTFTRWINLHLEKCDPPIKVHDLFQDVQDGHVLMALLEELSGCKLLHGFKKSSHRIFRLNNIAKVLSFLEQRNVKLVSIDAADVADGHSSIILGLIWNIILFFQIKELTGNIRCQFPTSSSSFTCSSSSFPSTSTSFDSLPPDQLGSSAIREQSRAIKKLLHWVQKRTRQFGVAVLDFGKSWRSGLVFLAVIKSIDPSLVDMRKALLRSARENLEEAFRIAHYGLGIPRLLEPEDVLVSAPDEQSIMIYVSQFLEHFPGMEQAEEPYQLNQRSISLCRLNFYDSDSKHTGNVSNRNTMKERSSMFQGDSSRQSNKPPISRLPEGRRSMCLPLRPVTSRSSEDLLRDSWQSGEETVDEPQELDRDLTEPICLSPGLPCPESSTGSSVLDSLNSESLTCNSALESPDSWADSDSAVMVETFGENQRVCSVCDSRTCDCVKLVVISTPDEGFIPSTEEENPPVDNKPAATESEEVIYFQRSSEKTREEFQDFAIYQVAAEPRKEGEKQTMVSNPVEEMTECNRVEVTNIIDSEQGDSGSSFLQDETMGEEVGPREPAEGEKLVSCDDRTETATLSQHVGDVEVPTPEETGKQNVKESVNSVTELLFKAGNHDDNNALNDEAQTTKSENQNEIKPLEDVEPNVKSDMESIKEPSLDLQDSSMPETSEAPVKTRPSHQEKPLPTPLDPSRERSSALQSTPTEQVERDVERTCDMEINVTKENEDFSIISCNQSDGNDKKDSGALFFPVIEHDEPTDSSSLDNTIIMATKKLSENVLLPDTSQIQENTTEQEQEEGSHTSDTDVKWNIDTSLENLESDSMETECDTNQQDKQQNQKPNDSTTSQQDTLDSVDSERSSLRTVGEDEFISAQIERSDSQIYDSVGVSVEPMDIFYPEKEEPVSSEPIDMEIQGWPQVLSVSALQPAPATDVYPDGQPLNLEEDLLNVEKPSEQVVDKEQSLLAVKEKGSPLGDGLGDNGGTIERALQGMASAKEFTGPLSLNFQDENQVPAVVSHREDSDASQTTIKQAPGSRNADKDSDIWSSKDLELQLLLLLWMLLYCFWLLPRMDVKELPHLLLNL